MRLVIATIVVVLITISAHAQTPVDLHGATARIHVDGIANLDTSYTYPSIVLNGEIGIDHYDYYETHIRFNVPSAMGVPWIDAPYQSALWEARIFGYGSQRMLYAAGIPYGYYNLAKATWTRVGGCFRDEPFDYSWCMDIHGGWPERGSPWDYLSVPEQSRTFTFNLPAGMSSAGPDMAIGAANFFFHGLFQFESAYISPCAVYTPAGGVTTHNLTSINSMADFVALPTNSITFVDEVSWCGTQSTAWQGCADANGSGRIVVELPTSWNTTGIIQTYQKLAHELMHHYGHPGHVASYRNIMRDSYSQSNTVLTASQCDQALMGVWSGR